MAYEGAGRRLVLALKHGDRLDTAPAMARWMAEAGCDILSNNSLIVPVPLHWRRLLLRKYNQASELAKSIADITGASLALDALHRNKATKSLKGLKKEARLRELDHAISPNPECVDALGGAHIVLIDDVMTTGATLSGATDACNRSGAKQVDVLVFARVSFTE